jgi:hypothetical protein
MPPSPLMIKTHDFLQWLLPQVAQFPKAHRAGLARHLQEIALEFYDTIIAARMTRPNAPGLQRADIALTQVRQYLRLSCDLGFLSFKQFEHSTRMTDEMGKLLGGWLKKGAESISA